MRLLTDVDAGIVDQDVDTLEADNRLAGDGGAVGRLCDVSWKSYGLAAFFCDQRDRLLGTVEPAIDAHHLGALAGEEDRHGAAIANRFAGRLAGADDDGFLVL